MKWFSGIRVIALLRRIARALEEANELARLRMTAEYPDTKRYLKPKRGRVKQAEIYNPTSEDWNEAYRAQHGR